MSRSSDPVLSVPITLSKGNDILALSIHFTKDILMYKVSDVLPGPLTGQRKCTPSKELHDWCQKKKEWIFKVEQVLRLSRYFFHWKVWLMHNTDGQCTKEG